MISPVEFPVSRRPASCGRSRRAAFAFTITLFAAGVADGANRPNIVLLTTNHQAAGLTGFEGHRQIKTPNLDELAKESTFFPRCYTPTLQSTPGRASILTGQYPHALKTATHEPRLPAGAETFSGALHSAGYVCAIVGQWEPLGEKAFTPDHGFTDYTAICAPSSWLDHQVWLQGKEAKADQHLTEWIADRANEYLAQPREKPFFLWVNFVEQPESPTLPPGVVNAYPPDAIELPKSVKTIPDRRPPVLLNTNLVRKGQKMDEAQVRDARSKYYTMMTYTDTQIGRVLKRMNDLNLRENTAVVYASTSGWALGDHQLFTTGPAFYEELIRGPLLVRYPSLTKPGARIERIVSLVDLAPTFMELAGVAISPVVHGQSLLPVLGNPAATSHRDEAFVSYSSPPGEPSCIARAIVTDLFKYVEYMQSESQLYDLKRDGDELHNAVGDMEYAAVVKVLSTRLRKWQETTKDSEFRK
ncbi:MAG TPA: sulfatase-like hydrolase/transferase [Phycisphaerae bacterium]|nr:sulfatase-like hydrolase/transferase [Phycisphaerae bacterium]HRY68757.1 sulfatase-like hydrolase/transferase [Phycisphaerae bacterium]HSA28920.1 sulfatase-like hydrolase/transferase [Phycisphaerae bacterium]